MDAHDIRLVRASLPHLLPGARPVVDEFYLRLFAIAPHVRDLFPDDMTVQNGKFVAMIVEALERLESGGDVDSLFGELGRRHQAYGAAPRHYDLVREALIWALAKELGPLFTPELERAWTAFYDRAARSMIRTAA